MLGMFPSIGAGAMEELIPEVTIWGECHSEELQLVFNNQLVSLLATHRQAVDSHKHLEVV